MQDENLQSSVGMESLEMEDNNPQTIKLLSPVEFLRKTWSVFKQRFWVFEGIMLVEIVVWFVATLLPMIGLFRILGLVLKSLSTFGILGASILFIFILIIVVIVAIFFQTWSLAALIYAIHQREERIGILDSYRKGFKKILSLWWVSFLVGIVALGGFFLFVIPGVIFGIWFSMAIFILVVENIGGMSALLKSKEYIKGRWWQVFGRHAFIVILSWLVLLPFYVIRLMWGKSYGVEIAQAIGSLAIAPIVTIYMLLLYENIKAKKGDFEFKATKKAKNAFLLIGLLGVTLFIALLTFTFIALGNLSGKLRKSAPLYNIPSQEIQPPQSVYR